MKRQHPYEELIGGKLNGLPTPEVTGLWNQMETLLDRSMPLQAKKKSHKTWWLNPNLLMALVLTLAFGGVYSSRQQAAKATRLKSEKNIAPDKPVAATASAAGTLVKRQ